MKIAIVGSRDYPRLNAVAAFVAVLPEDTEIVSGGARGVDQAAADAARRSKKLLYVFEADWKAHGKRAGFLRNQEIVDYSDKVVAFWDGKSRGTLDTITKARAAGKPVTVFGPDGQSLRPPSEAWRATESVTEGENDD